MTPIDWTVIAAVFLMGITVGVMLGMVVLAEESCATIVIAPGVHPTICKPFGFPCEPVERKPWTVL
jgi:hypothetical protein